MIDVSDLLETKFAYSGKGPEYYDCWTLIVEILRRMGKTAPDFPPPASCEERVKLFQKRVKNATQLEKPEEGCIVLFENIPGNTHCGIMIDSIRFIHMYPDYGVLIEPVNGDWWKHRVIGFYRMP
jgi:cell wall-associated NlpC family hydrolase